MSVALSSSGYIGSSEPREANFRVVAATNQDLQQLIEEKLFRADLFYRLNVFPIHIPPLRERRMDVPPLIDHFVALANEAFGGNVTGAPDDVVAALCAHDWPGNVRELQNILQRMCILRGRGELRIADLPEEIAGRAVNRTVRQLGPRKIQTQSVPVLFEPEMTAWLLGFLFSCVSGVAVYNRATFLMDKRGERIARPGIHIQDSGLLPRLLGSSPFDADGVPCRETRVLEDGVLQNFLCNTYAARKLGLESTGNASGSAVKSGVVSTLRSFRIKGTPLVSSISSNRGRETRRSWTSTFVMPRKWKGTSSPLRTLGKLPERLSYKRSGLRGGIR